MLSNKVFCNKNLKFNNVCATTIELVGYLALLASCAKNIFISVPLYPIPVFGDDVSILSKSQSLFSFLKDSMIP